MNRIAQAVRPVESVPLHHSHNLFSVPRYPAAPVIACRYSGHINGQSGFVQ
jgi:hypothetical protein